MGSKTFTSSGVAGGGVTGTRRMTCPRCKRPLMRRKERHGFWQVSILPLLGYFPWECANCRIIKLFRDRGSRPAGRKHRTPETE